MFSHRVIFHGRRVCHSASQPVAPASRPGSAPLSGWPAR